MGNAGRPKGLPKTGGGSRKGIPNKNTQALKDMILGALNNAGGVSYLERQAAKNPGAFMSLVGRVLPMTVANDGDTAFVIKIVKYADDHNPQ